MPRTAVHVAGTALLVALCTVGLGMPAAQAKHEEHGHDHGKSKTSDPAAYAASLTEKLGLSEEQSAQVASIVQEHHGKIQGVKDQITALKDQITPLKKQLGEMKQAKRDEIKAVLTLEQRVTFAEMKAEKRGHHKPHGPDCSCGTCALKRAESSKAEE